MGPWTAAGDWDVIGLPCQPRRAAAPGRPTVRFLRLPHGRRHISGAYRGTEGQDVSSATQSKLGERGTGPSPFVHDSAIDV